MAKFTTTDNVPGGNKELPSDSKLLTCHQIYLTLHRHVVMAESTITDNVPGVIKSCQSVPSCLAHTPVTV